MGSIAFGDFLIGVGILFVLEGILFAAGPGWMRTGDEKRACNPGQHLAHDGHRVGGGRA